LTRDAHPRPIENRSFQIQRRRRAPWPRLALLALCLVGLLLAGCLRRATPESIELTWWLTFAPGSPEYAAFQEIARTYTECTGYAVDLVSVPWTDILPRGTLDTQLSIAQASGDGPDVWGPVPHSWTGAFALKDQAAPLEAAQIESLYQYDRAALAACRVQETQYGLPVLADSVALIYNRDLVPDPPQTWDELMAIAKSLTDPEADRWGLVLPLLSQVHVYPFMQGYGGYLFACATECDPTDIGLNHEGSVRGVQFLSDLYLKERLFPPELVDREVMREHALRLFAKGRAGMLIDGPWVMRDLRASGIAFDVVPIPPLPDASDPPRPLVTYQAVYLSAHARHPDAALELLNHIASPDSMLLMWKAWSKVPVRRDALRLPEIREDYLTRHWREQIALGAASPNLPELQVVWGPWAQALLEAIPGYTPPGEALDRAVEQIRDYLGIKE